MTQPEMVNNAMFPLINNLHLPETSASSDGVSSPLVLVLSREPDTLFLFKTLLEIWNYRVETVRNFDDLFALDEQIHPSLLLIDATLAFDENMQRMLAVKQSEIFPRIPIIIVSGHAQLGFRNLALSLGADDYLVKPVDFDVLEVSLKQNIEKGLTNRGKLL
jgi:DNA-binding response OmpR family regulator